MLHLAPGGEHSVATVEPALRAPGDVDGAGGRAALSLLQGGAQGRVVTLLPGRFDQDAAQMRVAGFGDRAAARSTPARMFGWH